MLGEGCFGQNYFGEDFRGSPAPATAPPLAATFFVVIGGVDRTLYVDGGTQIVNVLTQQPNTASLKVHGFDPPVDATITIQDLTSVRFAGFVQRAVQHSVRGNTEKLYDLDCIDWTWLANRRRVTKNYSAGTSASVVFADIISTFTSGFTQVNVQGGAPNILADQNFRGVQVTVALQQIADLVGWRWGLDVNRDFHFYPTGASAPTVNSFTSPTTGSSFVVPTGVTLITAKAWGAAGGADGGDGAQPGGGGGFAQASLMTTPGETLTIKVGGGGARDGNSWQGGGGGGYSAVYRSATPLIIAGGGGGAAKDGTGGPGGGTSGVTGGGTTPGQGGAASTGGSAGSDADGADVASTAGSSLTGGTGGGWAEGSGDAGATGGTNGGGAGGAKGHAAVTVSYLVIGGGGAGGNATSGLGGGGGAGQMLSGTTTLTGQGSLAVTVGAGGASAGASGQSSSLGSIATAIGGGGGATVNGGNGAAGGSGGGGVGSGSGGAGTTGGNNGGNGDFSLSEAGGGGGGAGSAGGNAGPNAGASGGNGAASSISGASVTYAGGGAGSGVTTSGSGGTGGGGNGNGNGGGAGTANTGSGGGASAGAGGSGVLIISYPTGSLVASGGTVTTSGGNTIHTFTSSGTWTYKVVGRTGGGGGGGYFGGGGGGADGYTSHTGAGGGGSSYASGTSTLLVSGSGATPGNAGDSAYTGSAGQGSAAGAGNPGLVVLSYTPAPQVTMTPPDPLTPANYTYDNLEYQLDVSQVRTRVYGVGAGGSTTAPVAATATSIPVDECSWYSAGGGSLVANDQIVTYTGRSASSGPGNLTGVPASGTGSVVTAIPQGQACNVLVQVDDAGAQAAFAALEGGDGVREDWVEDTTWDLATATAQATATLNAYKTTDIRGSYDSYDDRTQIGQLVTIAIPARGISTTVTLQRVTSTHVSPNKWWYHAEFALVWSDLIDLITAVVNATAKPN